MADDGNESDDEHDVVPPPPPGGGAFKTPNQRTPKPRRRSRRFRHTLTLSQFQQLDAVLRANGYAETIAWSENIQQCQDADAFALEVTYVICNSGMAYRVANAIYWRVVEALKADQSATMAFGHPGKAPAIDFIWQNRTVLFAAFDVAANKLGFCATLPWIGPVTKFHLAKNLGVDVAKPDVHMERLARAEGVTVAALCVRLARESGYRISTIDTILWRACADGYLNSRLYLTAGWDGSTEKLREAQKLMPP